jgi:PhzF family phenazine biosynthesis protein
MKSFPFKKIDAFTKGLSAGNPCACIYLKSLSEINDREMQQIAGELKGFVSEVVYLFPEERDFLLKYYSAECEVNFCGHGTIGIMYDLIKGSPILINQSIIKIRVKDAYLNVYNRLKESDSVFIAAPIPRYIDLRLKKEVIAKALKIVPEGINDKFKPGMINAGLNTLIVPIKDLESCLSLFPDELLLKDFCLKNGIDIVLVFTDEVANSGNKYRTRVLAPKYGYLEDPATGSGNAAFGYYLLRNRLWSGDDLSIEQGSSRNFPNIVRLDTVKDGDHNSVTFGGAAVVKIEGSYLLAPLQTDL